MKTIKKVFGKVMKGAVPAMLAVNALAFADPAVPDIWTTVGSIIGVLCTIAMVAGIILLAVGLIQFAMAQKSEDVEGKSRAINVIIAALILISFKTLFGAIFTAMHITIP